MHRCSITLISLLLFLLSPISADALPVPVEQIPVQHESGGDRTARGDTLFFFAALGEGSYGSPGTTERGFSFDSSEGGDRAGWLTDGGPYTMLRDNYFLPGPNETNMWTFFDSETPEEDYPWGVFPYGPPYQTLFTFSPGLERDQYGAPMGIAPNTGKVFLRYDIYKDMPMNALIFYYHQISARATDNSFGPFIDESFVFYGESGWETMEIDITETAFSYMGGESGLLGGVRVRINVSDMCALWCNIYGDGFPHTMGALIDNVEVFYVADATDIAEAQTPAGPIPVTVHPNPFNPNTQLGFDLQEPGHVSLEVYDLSGRCVKTLIDKVVPAGHHDVTWQGVDDNGEALPSGVYLVRLSTAGGVANAKAILLK
ncbi:MAG: T9SS type A sorting domain-containing protein [bacterium]|nr:T9SS type A sorting domain-containing protein [bacterium]